MIAKCVKSDKEFIEKYIGKRYPECLYLYLDLKQYGCQSDFTQTWIQENEGEITAVLLAYHSALHVYSKDLNCDVIELTNFILETNPSIICASAELIKLLEPYICSKGFISEYGHIGKFVKREPPSTDYDIRLADKEDITQIAQLLYEDDDIGASYSLNDLIKQIEERLNDGFVRSYVIRENGHVVAHLGTGAETEKLCTISYVITAPEYRGKGLSSSLFFFACEKLTAEGKEIYSVYYPENSRRLHHKMGFEDCCEFGKLYRIIQ